jgi:hypothetical protein
VRRSRAPPIPVEVGGLVSVAKGTLEDPARVRGCESQGQILQIRCEQGGPEGTTRSPHRVSLQTLVRPNGSTPGDSLQHLFERIVLC